MDKIFTILFGLYALAASGLTYAELFNGTVSSVSDGDSITVQTDAGVKRVRLAGIDAPELKQPFGPESRDALKQSVLNHYVTIDTIKQDRYGRDVGKVLLEGEDINLKQLSRGFAWVYTDYIKELSVDDREFYKAAEKAANDDHIGLWQDDRPVAPWSYRKSK